MIFITTASKLPRDVVKLRIACRCSEFVYGEFSYHYYEFAYSVLKLPKVVVRLPTTHISKISTALA
jgi:hypothetical protein